MKESCTFPPVDHLSTHVKTHFSSLTGREDVVGAQIAALVRLTANQYEAQSARRIGRYDLSGPRLGVLMCLLWHKHCGETTGLTPSELSLDQHISRNTISALLRGLEDQGLIERHIDRSDRRFFRIALTDLGCSVARQTAPQAIDHMNDLVSDFDPAERSLLLDLLGKLYQSLLSRLSVEAAQPGS